MTVALVCIDRVCVCVCLCVLTVCVFVCVFVFMCVFLLARCQKIEKPPVSSPSVPVNFFLYNSDPSGRIFLQLYIRGFFKEKSVEIIHGSLKCVNNN